jgi:SsrA-binding protein
MEILNRKARYDYEIFEKYIAGIVLTGTEIKSIREGKCNLKDSYIIINNNEAFVLNMHISNYEKGSFNNLDEKRTRKLLLNKKEILKINEKIKVKGYTVIPLKLFLQNSKAKLEIGICKGKHNYDKRETIKERDIKRDVNKQFKYL